MSESNKFTPGPWFNGQDGFNLGCGVVYARHANGNPKDVATIRGWGGEQQQNSRLIASAPDLLEALEQMIDEYGTAGDGWPRNNKVLRDARAAISKARGQQ
mgnify:CR=1 FL=1